MADNTEKDVYNRRTQVFANDIMAMEADYLCTMLNDRRRCGILPEILHICGADIIKLFENSGVAM